jgi:hypothetical protein
LFSPPASLETQRTQSLFFFSLSVERPESEKQHPCGIIVLIDSPAFVESTVAFNLHHEAVADFHLPPSQRQMKK